MLGNVVFAIQDKTECWTAGKQGAQYQLYGTSTKCKNGRGAGWTNSVYQLGQFNRNQKWLNLGCFKDEAGNGRAFRSAIQTVNNDDAHNQCRQLALQRSHNYFGLESGFLSRQCFTGNNVKFHTGNGIESGCSNGRGGVWHINVYQVLRPNTATVIYNDEDQEDADTESKPKVADENDEEQSKAKVADDYDEEESKSKVAAQKDIEEVKSEVGDAVADPAIVNYQYLGCWGDNNWRRAFKSNAKRFRRDTIQKCADRARMLGNVVFAIQDKTECWTAGKQGAQYQLYGTSTKCKNGRGAGWTNSVYQLGQFNRNQKWLNLGCFKDEAGN